MCCFSLASSFCCFFFFKQKTAYEMRISDWSSDVCSSDLRGRSASMERGIVIPGGGEPIGGQRRRQCAADHPGEEAPARRSEMPAQRRGDQLVNDQIGRASCRARVCQYV